MRIIAGRFKNTRLAVLKDPGTRPSSERLREALFNILQPYGMEENLSFLDLFSGTGAMGLEALSRGFQKAAFVENSRLAAKNLKTNIEKMGVEKTSFILTQPIFKALDFLVKKKEAFDVIFLDPPYETEATFNKEKGWLSFLTLLYLDTVGISLLKEKGRVFAEEKNSCSLPLERLKNLTLLEKRTYGNANLYCFARPLAE